MKLAFLQSPAQLLMSITSRELLINVRTVVSCSSTNVDAAGSVDIERRLLVAPFGGSNPGSLRLISYRRIMSKQYVCSRQNPRTPFVIRMPVLVT